MREVVAIVANADAAYGQRRGRRDGGAAVLVKFFVLLKPNYREGMFRCSDEELFVKKKKKLNPPPSVSTSDSTRPPAPLP